VNDKKNGQPGVTDKQMARGTQALFDGATKLVSKLCKAGVIPKPTDMRDHVDAVLKYYLLSHGHHDVVDTWEKTGKWPHERGL